MKRADIPRLARIFAGFLILAALATALYAAVFRVSLSEAAGFAVAVLGGGVVLIYAVKLIVDAVLDWGGE